MKIRSMTRVGALCAYLGSTVSALMVPMTMMAAPLSIVPMTVVVNSAADGPIQPDEALTLREAIALTNGTLQPSDLSLSEKVQVTERTDHSRIEFALPPAATTIRLTALLPQILAPGLVIDGTTQPGYAAAANKIAKPLVALTPAPGTEIFRGLTLAADNITVRGLNLYGFNAEHQRTATTPPADILVVHELLPKRYREAQALDADVFTLVEATDRPPQGIVIEDNWLGMTPTDALPSQPSAFGVSVFNSTGTTIRRNRIAHHDGSAIITGYRAENLLVSDNEIIGNGLAGMPDAIRLDGMINNGVIRNNLICGNDGSAIFLFKPEGAVEIHDNDIKFNGQRLRRSAIYLMGNDHQVRDNDIRHQTGPGVTVAAYPKSDRNLITNNRFDDLEGLSIDLVARRHVGVSDYQRGDGANVAQRDTGNRKRDTGNRAINTPQFLSRDFILFGPDVGIDGMADPGARVTLYKAMGNDDMIGPLSVPLLDVTADDEGRFGAVLTDLQPGDRISAIATHPDYGTSEPALNAVIRALESTPAASDAISARSVNCEPEPVAVVVEEPEPVAVVVETPAVIPVPLQVEIPRNVHFALDQDDLSGASMASLDQVVAVLKAYPTIAVDLHGHTDSRASAAYNQDLAQRRAMSVRRYLLGQGIDPARLTIRSWGETQLLNQEQNREEFARNRRVEFVYRDVRGIDLIVINQDQDLQIEP